jgi:uncharacterized protein YndB with AHSA1/START domain
MATPQTEARISLQIARTLPAPRDKVFRAWTQAQALKTWFAPSEKYITRVAQLDVHTGGRYRIEMEIEGKSHIVVGTYQEVLPPEWLVFTWKWETEPQHGESVVTIELADRAGKTELTLTHEKFPSDAARDEHNKGWTGCLDRLGQYVA